MNKTTMPLLSETRIHFRVLDSWRGMAALFVALFHLNVLSAIYSLDFIRNGYLFVDFFFVLSGFVITHTYSDRLGTLRDLGTFAIRRLGRLWPLHAVVLLAFVAVEVMKAVSAARGASFYRPPFTGGTAPGSILTNLLFGQSFGIERQLTWNPPSWSICAEFWTYFTFAAALFIASNWLRRVRFASEIVIVTILIGSASLLVLFSHHGIDATFDLGLARCIYGFLVGHLTYRLWRAASSIKFRTGLLEWCAVLAVVGYVSMAGHTGYSFLAPLVFSAVIFIFAFEAGPVSSLLLNRGNVWLGRISYSIYMWQAFIIFNFVDRLVSAIEKITGHVLTTTDGAGSALGSEAPKMIVLGGHLLPIAATLLFVGCLVAVASVSYFWIEKPGQALFARLLLPPGSRFAPDRDRSLGPVQSAATAQSRPTADAA